MSNYKNNKTVISNFIREIWNERSLEKLDAYLHEEYRDYSFPSSVPPTKEGLRFWINNTSAAFKHNSTIESIVAEGDEVAVSIRFSVRHVGKWRGINPTGKEVSVKGFRFYSFKQGKILTHRALIDGEELQTALSEMHKSCEIYN